VGEIVRRAMSKESVKAMMIENAAISNILPVISNCNVQCKFCSHAQNPYLVETEKMPPISLDLVQQALSLMDPRKPVVIGESVTRLMEGEPFLHPEFRQILQLIRKKMPLSALRITTNGTLLDRDTVRFLSALGHVEICLSLNSADPGVRRMLMGDSRAEAAVNSAALLSEHDVFYHGSIVAMPHLTGWEDLSRTIEFLDGNRARTVRVLTPGYTSLAPTELMIKENLREELHNFIKHLRVKLRVPVTVEPPLIENLDAAVTGVMVGSPAHNAGMMSGDVIDKIDGRPVFSRVDAFKRLLMGISPRVELLRQGKKQFLSLTKDKNQSSGLVFDYDIDPFTIKDINRAVRRRRAERTVLIVSELGYPALKLGLEKMPDTNEEIIPVMAKNHFFGGSIGCAGLLTVEDMKKAMVGFRENTDLIVIPAIAFDKRGRDLTGHSYLYLKQDKGPELEVI